MDSIREFSYLEAGNLDSDEPRPKANKNNKRTSVSRLVVKLHSQYRCRLARRTPYAYSPAVDGSVLIVAVRECIVASGAVSAPRPLLGVGTPSVLWCCL